MAKLSADEQQAIAAGYAEGERLSRTLRPCQYVNPHLWSSRMWEAFELGYYLQERPALRTYERGRGNTFFNADGFTLKMWYGKGKNSFGITRGS